MPYLILCNNPNDIDEGNPPLFCVELSPFDPLLGIPAILSAISNLPKEAKVKRPRSDKGKSRKKVEATA